MKVSAHDRAHQIRHLLASPDEVALKVRQANLAFLA